MATLVSTSDLLHLLGDSNRLRLLALLERHELSVADLTAVTQLSQSRVSAHLARLREAGLLHDRRVRTSTLYRLNEGAMPNDARELWALLRARLDDDLVQSDLARCQRLLDARAEGSAWPDEVAGEMERHYSPGRTWESLARTFLGLVQLGDVLDVGSGDGAIAQLLAPRVRSIVCLDRSARVLSAARRRLAGFGHVRYSLGDMHALPFHDGSFDHVLLLNVLTYARAPEYAVAEAARVLKPDGGLTLVTLDAHQHPEATQAYRHLHAGFEAGDLQRMFEKAGFALDCCQVTSRERRKPNFRIVNVFARKAHPSTVSRVA